MIFEWDENKNKVNMEKHYIDFATASEVFIDSNKIVEFNRVLNSEIRLQVIGQIQGVLTVIVVFTPRNDKIRIISARRANKKEKGKYNDKNV